MFQRVAVAMVLACAFAACRSSTNPYVPSDTPDPTVDLAPAPLPTGIKVVANDMSQLDMPQGGTTFSLLKVRELYVRLQTANIPSGMQWLSFELYDPAGGIYDSRHIPFTMDGTPTEVSSMDPIPHPVQVERIKSIPGGVAYDQVVLVGGTNMVRFPRPGIWRLVASLVGQSSIKGEQTVELGMFQ
jgi:hypothetical protein